MDPAALARLDQTAAGAGELAHLVRVHVNALVAEGFSPDQAVTLVAALLSTTPASGGQP